MCRELEQKGIIFLHVNVERSLLKLFAMLYEKARGESTVSEIPALRVGGRESRHCMTL